VLDFSLQSLLEIFYALVNVLRVSHEVGTETHDSLHPKCLLLLSHFNQNWDVSTNCNKILEYKIL
jgi:hypothetical protein